jgi:hypothetical protein
MQRRGEPAAWVAGGNARMWTIIVSRSISAAVSRNGDCPGVHEHVGAAAQASYARLLGDSAGAGGEKEEGGDGQSQ